MYFIVKDNLPIKEIENEGFINLINVIVPKLKLPDRKTLSRMIEQRYDQAMQFVSTSLKSVDFISLTCDLWTDSHNCRSFLGLTGHFLAHSNVESLVLATKQITESHTSKYLAQQISSILGNWQIDLSKVVSITTDNANNIKKPVIIYLDQKSILDALLTALI